MTAIGGGYESVTINGRTFMVAADSDANRQSGGKVNEVQMNGQALSARLIKTNTKWMVSGVNVSIDDDAGDHEYLQAQANLNGFFPISFTEASGLVWQGTGQITGEMSKSSQSATMPLEFSGPGVLTQQV